VVNPPPRVSLTGCAEYDVGETLRVNVSVIGGTPPYNVSMYLNGVKIENANMPLNNTGRNEISVLIKDADEETALANFKFYVNDDPNVSLSANQSVTEVGLPVYLHANVSGGSPPYSVSLMLNGSPIAGSSMYYDPSEAGASQFVARVLDSTGYETASAPLTVVVLPRMHVGVNVQLSSDLIFTNSSMRGSVEVRGGRPPYVVSWYVNGKLVQRNSTAYSGPLGLGSNHILVEVTDSLGMRSSASFYVCSGYNLLGIGLVIALVLAGAALGYAYLRRSSHGKF